MVSYMKRLLSAILIIVLALMLVTCGGREETTTGVGVTETEKLQAGAPRTFNSIAEIMQLGRVSPCNWIFKNEKTGKKFKYHQLRRHKALAVENPATRPSTMASRSVAVSTPHWHNMRAWAIDPVISYWASRRSKCSDAVNVSTAASVLSLKRPPQSFSALMTVTGVGTVLQYTLRVIRAACSKAALPKPGHAAAAGGPAVTAGPTYTMLGLESALPTGERRWAP